MRIKSNAPEQLKNELETISKEMCSTVSNLWFQVGINLGTGKEEKSKECLRQIIELNPCDAAAYMYLGRIHLEKKQYDKAEYYLAIAAELDPEKPEVAFNYGTCLGFNGEEEKAQPWLEMAVRIKPDDSKAHHNLAMSYLQTDREELAMHHFTTALELDPQKMPAAFNLGIYFSRNNIFERARHYFELCVCIMPDFLPAWQQLIIVHVQSKDLERASMTILRAMQHNPDNQELIVDSTALANLHEDKKELKDKVLSFLEGLPQLAPMVIKRIEEFELLLRQPVPQRACETLQ